MHILKFFVPGEHLPHVLAICESYPYLSWYEDETSYTDALDAQGFQKASRFFVEVYVNEDSLLEKLKDFSYERMPLPSFDMEDFKVSRQIGRIWINPPTQTPLGINIQAATAFGSGEHPTTECCLRALSDLTLKPRTILDLGCGSGILALACAKLWPNSLIWASDIDPESVAVTGKNAQKNCASLHVFESKGFDNKELHRSYDLIVSNILSGPLIDLAAFINLYAKNILVLSGLLTQQKERILSTYRQHGFYLNRIYEKDGWVALVLQKKESHSLVSEYTAFR